MPYAIRLHQNGGPEVLSWEAVDLPAPAPGEATVRHHAVGLNFIDVYHRSGLYPVALPSGIGMEGAGVVEALGEGVTDLKVGDRVAYAGGPLGAYAEVRNIPAHRLLKLPDAISFETGAAMMDNENAENPRVRNVKLAVDLARHSANSWNDAALPDDFTGIRDLLHINQQSMVRRLGVDEATSTALLAMGEPPMEEDQEPSRSSEAP